MSSWNRSTWSSYFLVSLNSKIRKKRGRTKHSAKTKQKHLELATISFRNEVACKCTEESYRSAHNRLNEGRFNEIVKEIRILRSISKEVTINRDAIERRTQHNNLITCSINGRRESPLVPYEDHVVDMTINLSRWRNSISTYEGMELINSMIEDTPICEKHRE